MRGGRGLGRPHQSGQSRGLENLPAHGAALDQKKVDIASTLDSVWRCVVAVGTIPALFAIIFRLTIPESPRYTMDVLDDGMTALYDLRRHDRVETTEDYAMQEIGEISSEGDPPAEPAQQHTPNYFTAEELHQYFIAEGNWTWLAATSMCWFLLDFAFCGLGIDNPRRIAAIWATSYPNNTDFQSTRRTGHRPFRSGTARRSIPTPVSPTGKTRSMWKPTSTRSCTGMPSNM